MKRTLLSFGVIMVALTAVLIAPSPYQDIQGGIVLCGDEKQAEVYGPKLPETIVGGYTQPTIQSVVLPAETEEDDTLYVYASANQKNYHLGTCRFAYASGSQLILSGLYPRQVL
jgi:hypothetical protein